MPQRPAGSAGGSAAGSAIGAIQGGGGGAGAAARNLAGFATLLGQVNQFQSMWGEVFGRNPARDGDLVPGGLPPLLARPFNAIGLQALLNGIALERQGMPDAAAASYARAAEAAQRSADAGLLQQVRERQLALECKIGIGTILNTGQNPEDRHAKYQALRGTCSQATLAQLLDALIELERDRLPPGASAVARAQPSSSLEALRRRLRKLLSEMDDYLPREDAEPPPYAEFPGAAPSPSDPTAAVLPADDHALARAKSQQDARRRIYCSGTSDPQGCIANPSFCIGAYANQRPKFEECSRAFHDPNIWYDAMGPFMVDPVETRRFVDEMLRTAYDNQFR